MSLLLNFTLNRIYTVFSVRSLPSSFANDAVASAPVLAFAPISPKPISSPNLLYYYLCTTNYKHLSN